MLVFCPANVSEGRRRGVIDDLVAVFDQFPAVPVLDVHSDADHHRSVISCAGPPAAMAEAMFALIRRAAERIDMNAHRGQHPRIGAADVIPFVPLRDCSLAQCRELARALGTRVGHELALPVYLYAAAADGRRLLADVRRGGFEGLRDEIGTAPQRRPDFGPAKMGSAGAVAIGARDALIAWNLWLETDDVQVARRIARRIRASDGGLPAVQALGLFVAGRAQVSMNLRDFRRTGLAQVMDRLRQEAAREGVSLCRSELVGLMPQGALDAAAGSDLLLQRPPEGQILENRLCETGLLRPTRPR